MSRLSLKTLLLSLTALASPAWADLPEFTDGQFSGYTPDAAHGEQVFNAAGCATCHSVEGNLLLLAGGRAFENRLGKVYAPNITDDQKAGIGGWSDAQFLNALLRGVSPEGDDYYGAFFPFKSYARMKPEDALDLRAYMKTLEKSDTASKEHEVNIISRSALLLFNADRLPLDPPADAQLARGQYLTEALGHCSECHTPRDGLNNMDMTKQFKGFMGFFGDYSPDISADRLKSVEPAAFITGVMRDGKKLNGRGLGEDSMRRIVALTSKLSLEDRAAIYAYLTKTAVDVASLPPEPQLVADAGAVAAAPTATDATAVTQVAGTPAEPAAKVIDAEAIGKETGSEGLMKIVAAACEPPAVTPALTAAPPAPAPQVIQAVAKPGVSPEIELAADEVMDKHCRTCHGPGQRNDKTFPMHDIVDMSLDRGAVIPGDPEKSPVYASIANNRMPLGPKLTSDELDAIRNWINALGETQAQPAVATPAPAAVETAPTAVAAEVTLPRPEIPIPRFVGGDFTQLMMAAVSDLQAINDRDRAFMRYFSFAEVQLPEVDCTQEGQRLNPMKYLHAGLNKFVNSVSRGPRLTKIAPVAGTDGGLVRIDIRDFGWTEDDWLAVSTGAFTQGAVEAGFTAEAWADLTEDAVYPYAIDPASDSLLSVLANGTNTPVPIVEASWFTHHVSEAPYYDMLLRLPDDIRILEARMGVNVDDNIRRGEMVRAGYAEGSSGVSDHNRMIERHDLPRGGYYWKSYDFAGSSNRQSLLLHPDGPAETPNLPSYTEPFEHDGGEMLFTLANGMQGYYLSTNLGIRLQVGPTSIVSYRNKPIGKGVEIVNARSCFDCHENAIIRKSDELRKFIESSNTFNRDQREILLEQYIPAEEMETYFAKDAELFRNALSQLGVTEKNAAGLEVSLQAPGPTGGEIVTYLSDLQFENLDLEQVARLFYLTEEEFRERIRSMGDPALMQIVDQWINRVDDGLFVRRAEIEAVWSDLLPRLTDLRPYNSTYAAAYTPTPVQNYEQSVAQAYVAEAQVAAQPYVAPASLPAYTPPPAAPTDPLRLELSVPVVNVRVNDLLQFDVRANRRCELQVLYVEETKTVEELPPEVLGPAFLEAGETRRIPYPGSGFQLRFDTPGQGETMVAFCREGGLGDKRISGQGAVDYAKTRFQPLSRGLVIERTQTVAEDSGLSATNVVTFNVAQ